jgi:hypothetical protein
MVIEIISLGFRQLGSVSIVSDDGRSFPGVLGSLYNVVQCGREKSMYNFKDSFFKNEYIRYIETRKKGLKKQSNKELKKLMQYFDGLDDDTKIDICTEFCVLRFEENKIEGFNYFLTKRILEFLERACLQNQMPHLRWYYQIKPDVEMLKKAYKHIECDEKTVRLLCDAYLSDLEYGAHHFPDVCLFKKEVVDDLLNKLQAVLDAQATNNLKELNEEYLYYSRLYADWWTYESESPTISFEGWCIQNERKYRWARAYYY